jgi:antitoxin CptB
MNSTESNGSNLDARRRRARFRAWHRGTREMDLLLGRFADAYIASLSDSDLVAFEAVLELPDPDLFVWIIGPERDTPGSASPILRSIRDFYSERHGQD